MTTGVLSIRSGYDAVRLFVAVLLLVASALKCWQLATEPVLGNSILDSRWLLMATVEGESLFALWLLADVWTRPTWAAALACFGVFTCVSLCKAASGYASCGCFGQVMVSPWYTTVLDLVVVGSLLRWRPRESFFIADRAAAVVMIWLLIGIPAAFAMGSYTDTTVSEAGEIVGDGRDIVLKPETWNGKRFPLLSHIDVGGKLAKGLWLVLLHRHDCSSCREAASEYKLLAKDFSEKPGCPQIALVECPPFAPNAEASGSLLRGRMDGRYEWHLSSPTSVLIDEGQVQSVFTNAGDVELVKAIWGRDGT